MRLKRHGLINAGLHEDINIRDIAIFALFREVADRGTEIGAGRVERIGQAEHIAETVVRHDELSDRCHRWLAPAESGSDPALIIVLSACGAGLHETSSQFFASTRRGEREASNPSCYNS